MKKIIQTILLYNKKYQHKSIFSSGYNDNNFLSFGGLHIYKYIHSFDYTCLVK